MSHTNKVIAASVRVIPRYRGLLCCALALLFSALCGPPTSPSVVVASGARLRPSLPRRRRITSPAFLPHESGMPRSHEKRRRGSPERTPIMCHELSGMRCGGSGIFDEESNNLDHGREKITRNVGVDKSSPSQESLVDVSVVETKDSLVSSNDSLEWGGESGMGMDQHAQEDGGDAENTNSVPIIWNSRNQDDEMAESEENSSMSGAYTDDAEEVDDVDADTIASQDDGNIHTYADLEEERSRLLSTASDCRAKGKALHDGGDPAAAAVAFRKAASLLEEVMSIETSEVGPRALEDADRNSLALDRATCRLHEALCLLKDDKPVECVAACTDVLEDGVTVAMSEAEADGDHDEEEGDDYDAKNDNDLSDSNSKAPKPKAVVKIIPHCLQSSCKQTIPPQIKARAHHRRAKARLALGDLGGALEDARSAAFMGDRNAVQLYGRLMREGGGAGDASTCGHGIRSLSSPFGLSAEGSIGGVSNPLLESILQGMGVPNNNPLMPSSARLNDLSTSLLSSLLNGSTGNDNHNGGSHLGLLGDLFMPSIPGGSKGGELRRGRGGDREKKGGGGIDGLAKSFLSSLVKRIEDKDTQKSICNYLHSTDSQQVMQFATMAGVPIKEESARRLVALAGRVSPKGISKCVYKLKRGISIFKTMRKLLKVIDKYKAYLILAMLGYWIRSAVVEPYPASLKRAKKLSQKAALNLLIMPLPTRLCSRSLGDIVGLVVRVLLGRPYMSSIKSVDEAGCSGSSRTDIEEEFRMLKNQFTLTEALKEQNKAQVESSVDEQVQWKSHEEDERVLLSRDSLVERLEALTDQFVILMGQKPRDGHKSPTKTTKLTL